MILKLRLIPIHFVLLLAGLSLNSSTFTNAQQVENSPDPQRPWLEHPVGTVRFATFNTAMNRETEDGLLAELKEGQSQQAKQIAEIIQRVRPDVLLLCEIDRDEKEQTLKVFQQQYLEVSQNGLEPIVFEHVYFAESNTGVPSKIDLNGNGKENEPDDAFGFGQFPGKYAMAVVSRFPIQQDQVRTFQKFPWTKMPDAHWPKNPETGEPHYPEASNEVFRLSSKSHWDLPVQTPVGLVHFLTAHPTPPVFDGPEDRNGLRNHDEIRMLADLVDPSRGQYLIDDAGKSGALPVKAKFVIAGDMNADPNDGDSSLDAIGQLLEHPLINSTEVPASLGAKAATQAQKQINLQHKGPAEFDTSDFNDRSVGNLRLDYVLPSKTLEVVVTGVFWPAPELPESELVEASDHRLVWVDVK